MKTTILRILSLVLCLAMTAGCALELTACGQTTEETPTGTTPAGAQIRG